MKRTDLSISPDMALRDMELWNMNRCEVYSDYETLWRMFHAVIKSSSWGTSEYGGPVWLMDFSLANLEKLYPDNPWLSRMWFEWMLGKDKLFGYAKSERLGKFSDWFRVRAQNLIEKNALGNVILKLETGRNGSIFYYAWGGFLEILKFFVNGHIYYLDYAQMREKDVSVRDMERMQKARFHTYLSNYGGQDRIMVEKFPYPIPDKGIPYLHSDKYGDCSEFSKYTDQKGYLIPENKQEKFLIIFTNDLMEHKAQGRYSNIKDCSDYKEWAHQSEDDISVKERVRNLIFPYPKMRCDEYLYKDDFFTSRIKLEPTPSSADFTWVRRDFRIESIKIELPKIAEEYGEFWHRQFPLKQHWRVCEEF